MGFLTGFLRDHLGRHRRFYLAALVGVVVWAAAAVLRSPLRLAVAGDAFFGTYLALMTALAIGITPAGLRSRASSEDEGILLIILLTLTAIGFSLVSIFALLNQSNRPGALQLVLSIASAPLGWFMLHTIAAFHYAHLYYSKAPGRGAHGDAGGLKFPATEEPVAWDFLYLSFVVGMTAQVSDIQVLNTPMRRLILAHSVVSFFFNTVLIALAVNVVVVLAQTPG